MTLRGGLVWAAGGEKKGAKRSIRTATVKEDELRNSNPFMIDLTVYVKFSRTGPHELSRVVAQTLCLLTTKIHSHVPGEGSPPTRLWLPCISFALINRGGWDSPGGPSQPHLMQSLKQSLIILQRLGSIHHLLRHPGALSGPSLSLCLVQFSSEAPEGSEHAGAPRAAPVPVWS